MDSNLLDLNLSLNPTYVLKPIATLLNDISQIHDVPEKKLVLNNSIRKYEEELLRVKQFKYELPQCNLLLMDAIEILKYEIMSVENGDCDSNKSVRPPIEFLPMKNNNFEDPPHTQLGVNPLIGSSSSSENIRIPNLNTIEGTHNYMSEDGSHMGFEEVDHVHVHEPEPVVSNRSRVPKRSWGTNYKERRAWTPQLHALFVEALGRLGGPQAATPKRITEIMGVDGLTVEQVKSHLQKYRMHFKSLPPGDVDPAIREAIMQDPWAPAIYYGNLINSAAGGGRVPHK